MSLFHSDGWVDIHQGDCREVMAAMPAQSVHAVITSPPFWGLRDYDIPPTVWGGVEHEHVWGAVERGRRKDMKPADETTSTGRLGLGNHETTGVLNGGRFCDCGAWLGCLGLEPTPALYVEHLVAVMSEVHRVLRDDGLLWLNLGDSFVSQGGVRAYGSSDAGVGRGPAIRVPRTPPDGMKHKDLVGIPWMTALALREAGWYLRRDVIWSKDNAMPESVDDRPTSSHEYIFMLAKSGDATYWTHRDGRGTRKEPPGDYLFRNKVTRAEQAFHGGSKDWVRVNLWVGHDYFYDYAAELEGLAYPDAKGAPYGGVKKNGGATYSGRDYDASTMAGRRKRSVWNVNTRPYPGAHYAVFPPDLVSPMVNLATSERGVCEECGAPWERQLRITKEPRGDAFGRKVVGDFDHGQAGSPYEAVTVRETVGWQATCEHFSAAQVPATVLDPFAGSGTVGFVAQQLRRRAVLIDLNGDYLRQQMARTTREFGVGGTYAREGQPEPEAPWGSIWGTEP